MSLLTFFFGFIFGLGLLLSGMANPAKVLAFLDVAGYWDPSLAFVMIGAIGVAVIPFQLLPRTKSLERVAPVSSPASRIDRPLVLGSVVFGIGWGLGGYCPGPAIVGLASGYLPAAVFVIAMVFGIEIYLWLEQSLPDRF